MYLIEVIGKLKELNPKTIFKDGFHNPHSYRGFYEQLAFEPKEDVSVEDMLSACNEANGNIYEGYKGGEYKMGDWTEVWISKEGDTGMEISLPLWRVMQDNISLGKANYGGFSMEAIHARAEFYTTQKMQNLNIS